MTQQKSKVLGLAITGGLATAAHGVIVTGTYNSVIIDSSNNYIAVDLDAPGATIDLISNTPGPEVDLIIGFNDADAEKPVVVALPGSGIHSTGDFVSLFDEGDQIPGFGDLGYDSGAIIDDDTGNGPWDSNAVPFAQGYVGLAKSTGEEAWVYIRYEDAANSVQLLATGYNTSGGITAGQTVIPEPANAAALAAALAGSAVLFARRRRIAA